jgi:putative MATE family efflux protein
MSDYAPAWEEDYSSSIINLKAPTWRVVLTLAWPVLIQQLLILTVTLSDRFLAGNLLRPGPTQLSSYQAAQTLGDYIAWFITSFTVLVTVGSTALVARFVGAGNWHEANHATGQSVLFAVLLGLVGTLGGFFGLDPLVRILQLQGDAAALAVAYLRPIFSLLVFQVIEAACIACLVGAGDTRMGLYIRGGVALLNLPLAWGLFQGWGPLPELGFTGITLGTAISHLIGGLAGLVVLVHGRAGLRLRWGALWPDGSLLYRLVRISIPAGVDSMSVVVGQFWFLSIVMRLGNVAASAHGIAINWEGLGYMSGGAFGTAAMALVGQNLGARQPQRARHASLVAFRLGCAVMCVMGVIFFSLAPYMFLLFCPDPEQQPIIEAGVPILRLVAFAMPALACWIVFSFALRGAGDTRIPVLFTWIGFLGVRIPLAYLLTQEEINLGPLGTWQGGLIGAWIAMLADLLVRGGFIYLRFASGRWQKLRV